MQIGLQRWMRDWQLRRRAGLRTWTRPLGDGGLTAEAEAWIRQIEDQLRIAETRLRGQLTRRARTRHAPFEHVNLQPAVDAWSAHPGRVVDVRGIACPALWRLVTAAAGRG